MGDSQHTHKCKCGNDKFLLFQTEKNIKAGCSECGDINIIAWNSSCSVKNLNTGIWRKPVAVVQVEEVK